MNNTVLGKKIFENVRKDGNIKLVTTERRRKYFCQNQVIILQSFSHNLLAIGMKKAKALINKLVCLLLLILELIKVLMYDFWCDYVRPKYGQKAN